MAAGVLFCLSSCGGGGVEAAALARPGAEHDSFSTNENVALNGTLARPIRRVAPSPSQGPAPSRGRSADSRQRVNLSIRRTRILRETIRSR